MNPGPPPRAGWYNDPSNPTVMRWFDGTSWTQHTQAPGAGPPPGPNQYQYPSQYGGAPGFSPAATVADAQKKGQLARKLLPLGAVAYGLNMAVMAVIFTNFGDQIQATVDAAESGSTAVEPVYTGTEGLIVSLGNVSSLVTLLVGVFFLIWFNKAARAGIDLGRPARRTPGWAVAGFLIPIINFWFPYQSAIDMVPPGHRAVEAINRWWLLWIVMSLFVIPVGIAAVIAPTLAWGMAIVGMVIVGMATVAAQKAIDEITTAQMEMAAGQGGSGFPSA